MQEPCLGSWKSPAESGSSHTQAPAPAYSSRSDFCHGETSPPLWLFPELWSRVLECRGKQGRCSCLWTCNMPGIVLRAVQVFTLLFCSAPLPGRWHVPYPTNGVQEKGLVPSHTRVWQSWDSNPAVSNSKALAFFLSFFFFLRKRTRDCLGLLPSIQMPSSG